jgi:hypothetical protein
MKRLAVLLCALLFALTFAAGCESGGPFDAAIRDANGANMQMKGFKSDAGLPSRSSP